MKEQCGLTAQGEAFPNAMDSIHRTASTFRHQPIFAIGLYEDVRNGTILPATAKSVAEIGVSESVLEPTHALAWFFVGARPSFLGALLAYLVGSAYRVMAARARASQGALDPKVSSYANLVRAVTRRLASICGSDNLLTLEAAIMATVPTLATSKVFTFLIPHSRTCRLADLRRIRTVTAVADTEAQARAALAGLPLVFVSRRPSGEVAA
ncbi:ash family protein [Aeromonas media]|uniref:ash family protein n=1 Tax=Aeromonas media TaxID=651 RepID=UPI003D19F2D5